MMAKKRVSNTNVLPGVIDVAVKPDYIALNVPEEGAKSSYRVSTHLTNQMLKYDISKNETEIAEKIGIDLTPTEHKIVNCLCKILHHSSSRNEKDQTSYYTGNQPGKVEVYGRGKNGSVIRSIYPQLSFTLYDLTKEFIGADRSPSGKEIENVFNALEGLSEKVFHLQLKEEKWIDKNTKEVEEISTKAPLITLYPYQKTKLRDNIEVSKKKEIIIGLNPIFRRQIDSFFIPYPDNIIQRTIEANGSKNIPQATIRLRDYLLRELSFKHYESEIGLEKLYYLLHEKWMKEGRRKKVKEYTERAIRTVTKMGLLESHQITSGSTGDPKVIFTLNRDFK